MQVKNIVIYKFNEFILWYKTASRVKKIGIIILILLILFILTSPLRKKDVQYQTATVTKETIQEIVNESGNITANGQTGVTSPSNGVIEELYVTNGDTVTAGQTLFKIKAVATPLDQATAYTTYENAVSALQTAQNTKLNLDATMWTKQQAYLSAQNTQNYKNNNTTNPATKNAYTDLEKQQIDSAVVQTQKDFAASQQAYKTSDIAVSAAQASVNSTGIAYQATTDVTVSAPIQGTIENLQYGIGDKVISSISQGSQSTTVTPSPPVLYIVTNELSTNKTALVQVNEVDFPKIKQGQSAEISLPALINKKFNGTVVKIDKLGTNTSSVISFNVSVAIDNPDSTIAPNMTVNVGIRTARDENALTVPNSAIKPYKGGKALVVLNKSKQNKSIKYVPVTIGIKGIDKTEILSGVTEGTVVVLDSGAKVKPASGPFGG